MKNDFNFGEFIHKKGERFLLSPAFKVLLVFIFYHFLTRNFCNFYASLFNKTIHFASIRIT